MIEAHWNGSYPCLCFGEWMLKVNGKDVSNKIPDELRKDSMNTYGIYQRWYFDDNYLEKFESYEDGLKMHEWIKENAYWLDKITDDYNTQKEIFTAVQQEDFRSGSCGGCI